MKIKRDPNKFKHKCTDPAKYRYQKERIAHWDSVSNKKNNPKRPWGFYQRLLHHYYRFLVPSGLRILELGCGHGDLLACLKPSVGVGVDFSGEMIRHAAKKHPNIFFIQADVHEMEFKQNFDVILFDSAPTLPVTDSAILGAKADGVIFVYQAGRTSRHALVRAKIQLENVDAKIWGVIINNLKAKFIEDVTPYQRYRYYGYYKEKKEKK